MYRTTEPGVSGRSIRSEKHSDIAGRRAQTGSGHSGRYEQGQPFIALIPTPRAPLPRLLGKGRETALVQAHLDVAVPDALQVDHRRGDVAVAHPLLEGADVDPVLQVSCGIGVPELVQEPSAAKWAVGATIDSHRTILKLVRDSTVTAIELAAPDDGLQLFQHGAVGLARSTREERLVRAGIGGAEFLQQGNQLLRDRDLPLLPVFRTESPVRFGGEADRGVAERAL